MENLTLIFIFVLFMLHLVAPARLVASDRAE